MTCCTVMPALTNITYFILFGSATTKLCGVTDTITDIEVPGNSARPEALQAPRSSLKSFLSFRYTTVSHQKEDRLTFKQDWGQYKSSKITFDRDLIEIFCFMDLAQWVHGCVNKHAEETEKDNFCKSR